MVKVVAEELTLCACCACAAANGDVSGCRDYHEHPDHVFTNPDFPKGMVVVGDRWSPGMFEKCDGCGWKLAPFTHDGGVYQASVIV